MPSHDCIVVGTGGVGSAALFHLARRGLRVLGIDRFPPGHDRGSSHGETRVIRLAYAEHPDYVPLLRRSYTLWDELAAERGESLFHRTGIIQIGPEKGLLLSGVVESAARHRLEIERLEAREIERRHPGFRVPETMVGILERNAGFLLPEACVRAHAELAQAAGATILASESVRSWKVEGRGVSVRTATSEHHADRLVIAAGPWARELLSDLGVPLTVLRKPLFWFDTPTSSYAESSGFPVFLFDRPDGIFYGFPAIDERGLKCAVHSGGAAVTDPLTVDRRLEVDADDEARLESFLRIHLPGVNFHVNHHVVCFYTMTPDEHFVVDRHPASDRVVFAAGLSGHGFKMTTALGEILADLVLHGRTEHPIGFLGLGRPGLRGATLRDGPWGYRNG
jgi:sarcosine oxidase